ncbi:MAG: GNAT family N-acetyltransferase [bacterium]|jgi:GNAT superfamily N-acetyltransferase
MSTDRGATAGTTIREAQVKDGAEIADLSGQLGYPATVNDMKRRLGEICGDDNCMLLVAESDGCVVAWLLIHIYRLVSSDSLAQIAGLVVDEKHRNQGIGALLMERAEAWARAKMCRGVMLRSRATRKDAHNFYKRLGYACIKTQDVFLKEFKF